MLGVITDGTGDVHKQNKGALEFHFGKRLELIMNRVIDARATSPQESSDTDAIHPPDP